jgi:hypothetical protein
VDALYAELPKLHFEDPKGGRVSKKWLLMFVVGLVLGSCSGTGETDTSAAAPGTASATTTTVAGDSNAGSSLTSAELANSGTHSYASVVEVLECGEQPPPSLSEDRRFKVVVDTDQMSYDDINDDNPPLVWDRSGPNVFTREFTTDDGEHIAYTLTLDETGMVYYYDIDTVPCRRITWTMMDG